MNTFDEKLLAGSKGEDIVKVYIEYLGHRVEMPVDTGYNLREKRFCDLYINAAPVEVKLDIQAAKTGNIVIEHQSLKDHTAPHYIWVIPSFYYVSQTNLEKLLPLGKVVPIGDDGRPGTLVQIDSEEFRSNFTKL